MPRSNSKAYPEVTVSIKPGLGTLARRQAYKRFWMKLLTAAKEDINNEAATGGDAASTLEVDRTE